jgi:hypothetical protein
MINNEGFIDSEGKGMTLKEKMLWKIKNTDYVSFAELTHFLNDNGEYYLNFGKYPNVIAWSNCSENFIRAFIELVEERKIYVKPCSILVYLCDGRCLRLPIAKNFKGKKLSWFPTILRSMDKLVTEEPKIRRIIGEAIANGKSV